MHYWDFFPSGDAASDCIPVRGFATVIASKHGGGPAGTRLYGYFPMADEVDLEPAAVPDHGFVDGALHRRALPKVDNHYLVCAAEPAYQTKDEPLVSLLRPLFTTSFLIDDVLAENAFYGAQRAHVERVEQDGSVSRRTRRSSVGLRRVARRTGAGRRRLGAKSVMPFRPQRGVMLNRRGRAPISS